MSPATTEKTLAAAVTWAARPLPSLAALWLLGLLVFWPALAGPWLLDDVKLQDGITALQTGGFAELSGARWKEYLFIDPAGIGRPLAMATLAANALFSDQPAAFKAVNLVLHLGTGSLIWLLVRLLVRSRYPRGTADLLALVVALAWTLHPLQVSIVAYVVQRMTILSALFCVWALLLYGRRRLTEMATGRATPWTAWLPPLSDPPRAGTARQGERGLAAGAAGDPGDDPVPAAREHPDPASADRLSWVDLGPRAGGGTVAGAGSGGDGGGLLGTRLRYGRAPADRGPRGDPLCGSNPAAAAGGHAVLL